MKTAIITGAAGLVGSECVETYARKGYNVIGADNNMRKTFFGEEASTQWRAEELISKYDNYYHNRIDIRNWDDVRDLFKDTKNISVIIHTAAQPAHDWAATNPTVDFDVNARGTINILEAARIYSPEASFIHCSTSKTYGDRPNSLNFREYSTRYDLKEGQEFWHGIPETFPVDQSLHSLFGASKLSGDIFAQEYGRYFSMPVGIFRGSCLTGGAHSGTELHGFLAYLMKCIYTGHKYNVYGYKMKQVRDNIDVRDLVKAFEAFADNPRAGEVYNIGSGRKANVSMREAITMCEDITRKSANINYVDEARIGDHIWFISDIRKFQSHYVWQPNFTIYEMLENIYKEGKQRWDENKK